MVTAGNQSPHAPQFTSLAPETRPLPACLNGTKKGLSTGSPVRYNAILFPGQGTFNNKYSEQWRMSTPGIEVAQQCSVSNGAQADWFCDSIWIWELNHQIILPLLHNLRNIFAQPLSLASMYLIYGKDYPQTNTNITKHDSLFRQAASLVRWRFWLRWQAVPPLQRHWRRVCLRHIKCDGKVRFWLI